VFAINVVPFYNTNSLYYWLCAKYTERNHARNPASPAADKKRRQRLKMSQDKKDANKVKERLSKNAKCQVETHEDSAQRRRNNCECMKRKRLFETQEKSAKRKKTMRKCVTKQRQTETEEQGATRKKTDCDCKTKQWQTETEEQGAKHKKTMQECVTKQRQTKTEEQGA
jgi:hypothetical protein